MAAASKVKLKLLIDTKNQRVLFAEANKNTVDFLFFILSLPVGTVVRLLSKKGMLGCLGKLYESVENLDENYIQANQSKDALLKPRPPASSAASIPLLSLTCSETIEKATYTCRRGSMYCMGKHFTDDTRAICPVCRCSMTTKMSYVAPPGVVKEQSGEGGEGGGFVKGLVTYMVMDDLEVKPLSSVSSIALPDKLNVKEVGALEEKVVNLGLNEALDLLKTSLESKKVLTDVFLTGKGNPKKVKSNPKKRKRTVK